MVEMASGVWLGVGDGGGVLDVSECADLSGAGDNGRGLDSGGTGWSVRYRLPRVSRELWEDLPDSLQSFFDIRRDVLQVSLERRSSECSFRCQF